MRGMGAVGDWRMFQRSCSRAARVSGWVWGADALAGDVLRRGARWARSRVAMEGPKVGCRDGGRRKRRVERAGWMDSRCVEEDVRTEGKGGGVGREVGLVEENLTQAALDGRVGDWETRKRRRGKGKEKGRESQKPSSRENPLSAQWCGGGGTFN